MNLRAPYRPAMSVEVALEELGHAAGTRFDAAIVTKFCNTISLHAMPDLCRIRWSR
jgi:HD-GYP domain-containing protein (c-di-GMP phosphodiesterase class II)